MGSSLCGANIVTWARSASYLHDFTKLQKYIATTPLLPSFQACTELANSLLLNDACWHKIHRAWLIQDNPLSTGTITSALTALPVASSRGTEPKRRHMNLLRVAHARRCTGPWLPEGVDGDTQPYIGTCSSTLFHGPGGCPCAKTDDCPDEFNDPENCELKVCSRDLFGDSSGYCTTYSDVLCLDYID